MIKIPKWIRDVYISLIIPSLDELKDSPFSHN